MSLDITDPMQKINLPENRNGRGVTTAQLGFLIQTVSNKHARAQ
jgi:hypothetical protein